MFGIVTIDQPEMRFKDFYLYRSYYCGLCTDLKRKYGNTGRITLGYDMTFLIILMSGLYDTETVLRNDRCIVHPFRRKEKRTNLFSSYAADMNLLLTYCKCMDDWNDERKYSRRLYASLIRKDVERISAEYPEIARVVKEKLTELSELERNWDGVRTDFREQLAGIGKDDDEREMILLPVLSGTDRLASCFGRITEEIFDVRHDNWSRYLRQIGFFLGKFIYVSDAFADIEEDLKKSTFNPLKEYFKGAADQERMLLETKVEEMLRLHMAKVSEAFEMLPVENTDEILKNIIYSGVWRSFRETQQRRKKAAFGKAETVNEERTE